MAKNWDNLKSYLEHTLKTTGDFHETIQGQATEMDMKVF